MREDTPSRCSVSTELFRVEKTGIGDPQAIMYPAGAMSATVEVYTNHGIALVVEKQTDFVYHVVLFNPTDITEFKQIFSGLYLENRDEKAY